MNEQFYFLLDFELRVLKRNRFCNKKNFFRPVTFWFQYFTMSQILENIFNKKSDMGLIYALKRSRFDSFDPLKMTKFHFSCLCKKSDFEANVFLQNKILIEEFNNVSDFFYWNFFYQRVTYGTKTNSSRQILIEFLSSFLLLNSKLAPPHVILTTFCSIQPCTISAYDIFVNLKIAFFTVPTMLLELVFASILTFDFALVSHLLL